jgi:hypothetical protein
MKFWQLLVSGVVVLQSIAFSCAFGQSNKERYELDERCGRRAEQYFAKNYPNVIDKAKDVTFFYSYRNHYNSRLNKCMIYTSTKIVSGNAVEVHSLELLDLNENNSLGSFVGSPKDGKPATVCEVNERLCNTETEWFDLIKRYMEE